MTPHALVVRRVEPPLVAHHDPACAKVSVGLGDAPIDGLDLGATVSEPSDAKNACGVADKNVAAAEDAVLAAHGAGSTAIAARAWDHRSPPEYMPLVDGRFHLSPAERAMLAQNGFVVPERLGFSTYAWAFHELYQSEMPLYVSVDAILHAVFASNDTLIEDVEKYRLAPLLGQVLATMHCALADAAASYPADVARDLDVYLTVARSLLADKPVASVLGTDAEAAKLVALAKDGTRFEQLDLFGRPRSIDFTAYGPRGHYVGELAPFFRAAMWASRVEFNLASRASRSSYFSPVPDPRETPREATDGIALADLAERAGAMAGIDLLDRAWGLLAGEREDIPLHTLADLTKKAHVTRITLESAAAVRGVIGHGFQRKARIHPMAPIGDGELPAISTLLGPRIVPDSGVTRPLVHDAIANRYMVGDGDIAYALGHDRAARYTKDASAPEVRAGLARARALVHAPLATGDLYSAWFGAIRALADAPEGATPSFMATPAFADLRVDSAVAAFGQIRHNYVLVAGQDYGAAGCEIPDGFVDPAPHAYAALADYARRGETVMKELDPKDTLGAAAYFARLEKTLETLRVIAVDELAGRALAPEEKRFVSMVAEFQPAGTGGPATYTGWYFDLFRDRMKDGLRDADFVADYFTSPEDRSVAYAGAKSPALGFFVVDTGGAPRVMVGPVARAYVYTGPLAARLTDERARALTDARSPWAASYTVAAPAAPPFAVSEVDGALVLRSTRALGPVTIELLDHHRRPFAKATRSVGTRAVKVPFRKLGASEAVHVTIGAYDTVYVPAMSAMGRDSFAFTLGGMPAPEP